ncbi:MAG TPA: hypothetical protein VLH19_02165 [Patescibacteria group bacterium]|nr:hypothetical protein [Patescibacteria group bacterium]
MTSFEIELVINGEVVTGQQELDLDRLTTDDPILVLLHVGYLFAKRNNYFDLPSATLIEVVSRAAHHGGIRSVITPGYEVIDNILAKTIRRDSDGASKTD